MLKRQTVVLLTALLLSASAFGQADVGEVSFENSGAPAAQGAFLRGLALLHDFEYVPSAESFRKAQTLDPGFAMAYWGEAMPYPHPVWFQQDLPAARAVLQRLGATPAERRAKTKTERERDYLDTVETLYGEGTKEERDVKFADALARLHAHYPDDVNATAFYAVALLGTAHQGRDFATYMRAAALLEEVLPTHLQHPGVLHYLTHCYDAPIHAPLGRRAARLYRPVAPNAARAQHMTSHIFIAMGMWDGVIDANRKATAVVNRDEAAQSKGRMECGHYWIWLHYALLQKGQFEEARKRLDACRVFAFETKFEVTAPGDTLSGRVNSYAEMRAHAVASGGGLTASDAVTIPDGDRPAKPRFMIAYGDMLGAFQRGDAEALKSAVGQLHALEKDVVASIGHEHSMNQSERIRTEVKVEESDALQLIAAGKRAEGIALLEAATHAEQTMPLEFGPPVVPKPPSELLGDQYLAAGRASDAMAAYRTALERTPGRTPAVEGLARAQKSAGGGR